MHKYHKNQIPEGKTGNLSIMFYFLKNKKL